MMMSTTPHDSFVIATLGFAAAASGDGVAYVALRGAEAADETLVRVAFRCRPLPALAGRDVAYAALEAAAAAVIRHGERNVRFVLDDETVALDVRDHRPVPIALALPYVRVQCTLNRLRGAVVVAGSDRVTRDLASRARAEVALAVAA